MENRNNRGSITPPEVEELDKYLRGGSFINLVQAKADCAAAGFRAG